MCRSADVHSFREQNYTMEAFIEGVRLQPCLWNPLHPEYRESQVKDEAWQRVVAHFNNSSIPNSEYYNSVQRSWHVGISEQIIAFAFINNRYKCK